MKTIAGFKTAFYSFLAFIVLMILFRMAYTGTRHYFFIGWNLFLAWIPFYISQYFSLYKKQQQWKQAVVLAGWLLFFPNALYIVTDLVHLQEEGNMAWWYDAFLLFAAALAGLVMAFISMRRAELFLAEKIGARFMPFVMLILLFLGSYGVYLGRFERWNSWDVLSNPFLLAKDIVTTILKPVENYKVWAITTLFTLSYAALYAFLKMLPQAFVEIKNTGR